MNRDELLDAVASSSDDGPRLVYADWLQQQTDEADRAHGEFITLSCTSGLEPKQSDRAKQRLLELRLKHQRTWLGPVFDITDERCHAWSRGFLEGCAIEIRTDASVQPALGHPTWKTLRTLAANAPHYDENSLRALLTQPGIANLRALHAYQHVVEAMVGWEGVPRLSELAIAAHGWPLSRMVGLLDAECFAKVRRLHVSGCDADLGCRLARRGLTLAAVAGPESLANWVATLAANNSPLDEVRLTQDIFMHLARLRSELVLRRNEEGRWSALEIRWVDLDEARWRDRVILALGRLPENVLTHLTFVGPPTKQFALKRWKQRIVDALAPRQADLQVG